MGQFKISGGAMNERLKELARQAKPSPNLIWEDTELERFAELVRQDERDEIEKMFATKIWAYEHKEIVAAIRARSKK
jgi:hypothetical protein